MLDSFPDSIIERIIVYSQNPCALLISKRFHRLAQSNFLRATFLLQKFGRKAIFSKIHQFAPYCSPPFTQNIALILLRTIVFNKNLDFPLLLYAVQNEWEEVVYVLINSFSILHNFETPIPIVKFHSATSIFYSTRNPTPCTAERIIDINRDAGRIISTSLSKKNFYILHLLLNAHKATPSQLVYNNLIFGIKNHPKLNLSSITPSIIQELFDSNNLHTISLFLKESSEFPCYDTILTNAVSRNIFWMVENSLENKADVHIEKDIAVRTAAKLGHLEILKLLLCYRANIHAVDDEALRLSSKFGHLATVKYLLARGANISSRDHEALNLASANGHLEIVKLLLEKDTGAHSEINEALRHASQKGHLDIVKYLLDQNADVCSADSNALILASENGHYSIVKLLSEHGANIHSNSDHALRLASKNGHYDIVQYLISKSADIHAQNDYSLQVAARNGYLEIVSCLLENGANVHADSDKSLASASRNGFFEIVQLLLLKDACLHAKDNRALIYAAGNGHLPIVKLLVENGAKVNTCDDKPLRIASKNGHADVVKYLLEKGAHVYAKDNYALKTASENGHTLIVKNILDHSQGDIIQINTALQIATQNGHCETVGLILKYREKICLKNKNDCFLASLVKACEFGHLDIVKLLVESGTDFRCHSYKALRKAEKNHHFEIVDYFLQKNKEEFWKLKSLYWFYKVLRL
ncbi:hypothetical protein BB560_003089 [Smittium megazygosporum]|uniref:Uncharacterized protein n=1 Tax=Smittium megazygosporum TaxID=133381 RepID=A0A2T9ZCY9_9FUNG|nr:hypothetical protein BB560_003089 [Smittium megazygosporum]